MGQVPGPVPDAVAERPAAPPAGVVEGPLPAPLLAVVHTLGPDSGNCLEEYLNLDSTQIILHEFSSTRF